MRIRVKAEASKDAKMQMTSMIDVVFLLIIFFMLVTELSRLEAELIDLPVATKGIDEEPDRHRLVVNVTREGTIVVAKKDYSSKELGQLLRLRSALFRGHEGLSELPVKIRADANVEYKYVQRVMLRCMDEKVWKLSFGCVRAEEPGS